MARKVERSIEMLPVVLTPAELHSKAIAVVELSIRIEAAEQRRKDVAKQMAADVTALEAEARNLAGCVNQGYEMRDVECEVIYDLVSRAAILIRRDTGEEVRKRPMTEKELDYEQQRELPLP